MNRERGSQSITISAKTVAEAIDEAERRLDLSRDEIDITVISEGSKGFLGMGSENARILAMPKTVLARRSAEPAGTPPRVSDQAESAGDDEDEQYDDEQGLEPAIAVPAEPALPHREEHRLQPARASTARGDEEDDQEDDEQPQSVRADPAAVAEVAVEVVRELILRMGLDAQATVRSTGNPVVIDVMGDDLGLLIGRHGDTLSSLQYLVNAIVGRKVRRWCKVVVDVEHYRLRREDTLRTLATRQASRVRQNHAEISLEPMPAAERRVIHMALQNSPWVVTHSVGDEPNRYVVIAPRQAPR